MIQSRRMRADHLHLKHHVYRNPQLILKWSYFLAYSSVAAQILTTMLLSASLNSRSLRRCPDWFQICAWRCSFLEISVVTVSKMLYLSVVAIKCSSHLFDEVQCGPKISETSELHLKGWNINFKWSLSKNRNTMWFRAFLYKTPQPWYINPTQPW